MKVVLQLSYWITALLMEAVERINEFSLLAIPSAIGCGSSVLYGRSTPDDQ